MHLRRGLKVISGVALSGLLALAFAACVGQGEGERCDRARAGDTDCNSGLVCISVGLNSDICCPEVESQRTGACAGKTTTTEDTGTSADTGSAAETTAEAAAETSTETSTEAGAETSTEAGADASETSTDASSAG